MNAEYATDLVLFTDAVVMKSLRVIATVKEIF